MKKHLGFGLCLLILALGAHALAGEYYTYQDSAGKLVISNRQIGCNFVSAAFS